MASGVSCSRAESALDRASASAKQAVSALEVADPGDSYSFSYRPISPLFIACLSGIEDIDGVVDGDERVVRFTSRQRGGEVYSLDGSVIVDASLLGIDNDGVRFARVSLNAETTRENVNAIEGALGTGISSLLAGGAWPAHPHELVRAAIAIAASITSIDPDRDSQQAIRVVLNPSEYAEEFDEATPPDEIWPPLIDVHLADGGSVARLVFRAPDPTSLSVPNSSGEGYSMDYVFDPAIAIIVPTEPQVSDLDTVDLPHQATAIPCEIEE